MPARDTGETAAVSPSGTSADPLPTRPSWEAPAAAPPRAAARPAPAEASKPYYAAAPLPVPAASPPPAPASRMALASRTESVQYDLAGNPLPASGASFQAPPGQAGYPPAQAAGTAGVWPPQPTLPYGSPGGWQAAENGTDRVARLRWNWGAFLVPFWWCCFNGQKNLAWAVFAVNAAGRYVPAPISYVLLVVDLGIRIYLGLTGHRLAWASGRAMGDYDDFIRTQRAWTIWGFVGTILLIIGLAILFSTVAGFAGSYGGGFSRAAPSGSAPLPQGGN